MARYVLGGSEMAGEDLTLQGHIAFVRHYAVELRAFAYAAPDLAGKLRQIAHHLDADADQLERVAVGHRSGSER